MLSWMRRSAWIGWVVAGMILGPTLLRGQGFDNPLNPTGMKPQGGSLTPEQQLKIEGFLEPLQARRGSVVKFKTILTPAPGYHTYPYKQSDPNAESFVTAIRVTSTAVVPTGQFKQTPPDHVAPEQALNIQALETYEKKAEIEIELLVKTDVAPGTYEVAVRVDTQVCTTFCVPRTEKYSFKLTVTDEAPIPPSASAPQPTRPETTSPTPPPTVDTGVPGLSTGVLRSGLEPAKLKAVYDDITRRIVRANDAISTSQSGIWQFVLAGVFWGFISLLTPCVFPMIPITVSFFLKQSESQNHRPLYLALVYTGTIVGILTLSAVFLLATMQWLSQNPWMNFFIGALFVYFALSLFGMYEIELPSFLSRFTSSREGRGGTVGTVFMALTFTIISFACVAPFLGSFAGTSTHARPLWETFLGGFAFSFTFAAPFFFLALFPGMLKKMPRSGSWMNSVKVVMGFLEVAAALKFIRAGELSLLQGNPAVFFTYDLVLGLWVAISLMAGLYLLNFFRLPHDSPSEHLSVPRLMLAMVFLALAFYMTPGLFKHGQDSHRQRPAGGLFAWIDAFLLDEPSSGRSELPWTGNLDQAVKHAVYHHRMTGQRKLVFIDFTGIVCTNCRLNEHNVFPIPRVKQLMSQFELVQLTTDSRDEEGDLNKEFEQQAFGTLELPLYVILEPLPDGKILFWGSVGGAINNVDSFIYFLQNALDGGPKR